jgi:hypothetical protein
MKLGMMACASTPDGEAGRSPVSSIGYIVITCLQNTEQSRVPVAHAYPSYSGGRDQD